MTVDLSFKNQKSGIDIYLSGEVENLTQLANELSLPKDKVLEHLYRDRGDNFASVLDGQFAIVIVDHEKKRRLLVRDKLGTTPLYYSLTKGAFLASFSLRNLMTELPVVEPNIEYFVDYLSNVFIHQTNTQYKNVQRVPQRSVVLITPDTLRTSRYWELEDQGFLRYGTSMEYAEHFEEIFKQVMRRKLSQKNQWGTLLSRGIDSNLIAFVGNEVAPESRLTSYTLEFEWENARVSEVRDKILPNIQWDRREIYPKEKDDYNKLRFSGKSSKSGCDYWPTFDMFRYAFDEAQRDQQSHIFYGLGGDDVFTTGHPLAEAILERNPLRIWTALKHGYLNHGLSVRPIWHLGVKPLVSHFADRLGYKVRRRQCPYYLSQKAFKEHGVEDRFLESFYKEEVPFKDHSRKQLYRRLFVEGAYPHVFEQDQALASEYGMTMEYPFFASEIVEFSFQLPSVERSKAGFTKEPLRKTLQKYLPRSAVYPTWFQSYGEVMRLAIELGRAELNEVLLNDSCGESLGLWDGDTTRELLKNSIEPTHWDAVLSLLNTEIRLRSMTNDKEIREPDDRQDFQKDVRNSQTL